MEDSKTLRTLTRKKPLPVPFSSKPVVDSKNSKNQAERAGETCYLEGISDFRFLRSFLGLGPGQNKSRIASEQVERVPKMINKNKGPAAATKPILSQ